jgi:hypothetical protein
MPVALRAQPFHLGAGKGLLTTGRQKMSQAATGGNTGEWRSMESAPKDGTAILASVRATEQGPADVDVVRWAIRDERWIAADSDPGCIIVYADAEMTAWQPLPARLPTLRTDGHAGRRVPGRFEDEAGGSGI